MKVVAMWRFWLEILYPVTPVACLHCHAGCVSHADFKLYYVEETFSTDSNYHRSSDNLNQCAISLYGPICCNMDFQTKKLL